MRRTLAEKTGRSLDDWVALLARDGPAGHRDGVAWLKETHGLGHFQARLIADERTRRAL